MDRCEEIARDFIEGTGGLLDFYRYELASPLCTPPEVEGARWTIRCLINPNNRTILDELVGQSKLRAKEKSPGVSSKGGTMKGIMFKPDMHLAIREGRKTQARRLHGLKEINQGPDRWELIIDWVGIQGKTGFGFERDDGLQRVVRPRYHVNEVVYIKEAWAVNAHDNIVYRSDFESLQLRPPFGYGLVWKSPMFLKAIYARDFIQILAVRAERLQEITREDVLSEGCSFEDTLYWKEPKLNLEINWFHNLWDSINPKYPWNSNPFVFVYTFKKVEKL